MKASEKQTILATIIIAMSSAVQLYWVNPDTPTAMSDILLYVLYACWAMCNFIGSVVCVVLLLALSFLRIRSKYREAARVHCYGWRQKFPKFFRFIKWLKTDD